MRQRDIFNVLIRVRILANNGEKKGEKRAGERKYDGDFVNALHVLGFQIRRLCSF